MKEGGRERRMKTRKGKKGVKQIKTLKEKKGEKIFSSSPPKTCCYMNFVSLTSTPSWLIIRITLEALLVYVLYYFDYQILISLKYSKILKTFKNIFKDKDQLRKTFFKNKSIKY